MENYTSDNTGNDHYYYEPIYVPPYEPTTIPIQLYYYPTTKVKRITKTVEKYNKDGKYKGKKVITTEEEIIDKPIWSYTDNGDYIDEYVVTSCFNCSNLN